MRKLFHELQPGDVMRVSTIEAWGMQMILHVNRAEKKLKVFRPYVTHSEFNGKYAGVAPYIGFEQYEFYVHEGELFNIVLESRLSEAEKLPVLKSMKDLAIQQHNTF